MSFKVCVLFLLYIAGCLNSVKGLSLFPSKEAVVCEGEQLELMCTTNVSILQWTSSPLETDQGRVLTFSRFIASQDESQQNSSFTVNSTSLNVWRVSGQDELPLMSRLIINNVSNDLNGTKVNCTEREINNENTAAASTTLSVIGDILTLNHSKINASVTVIKFGANKVTALLRWTPQIGASYNVRIEAAEPKVAINISTTLTSAQIIVLYNTHYNVCVEATLCRQSVSTAFEIHYFVCDYPFAIEEENYGSSAVTAIVGSTNPVLVGTAIMLHCPPEHTLIGPENITCMENGEWEPDPGNAVCNDTLTATSSTMCNSDKDSPQCNGNGNNLSGTLIGTLVGLGSLGVVIITIIAVKMILKWKESRRKLSIRTINRDSHDYQQRLEGTLIYADIGPATVRAAQSSASISLDLDNSHVQYAQINFKMLEQEPSKSKEPHAESEIKDKIDDDYLEVNLDNILIQLRVQVSPIWYQFGEAAGIENEVLDKLADNCSPQECIVEMLDYWLRMQNELPTWRDIAKILKMINLKQLAAEIEMVYTTGKLPIELNTNILNKASQEFDAELEANESPPPIPPKRMEMKYGGRGFDHQNSSTKPKNVRPPPPPLPVADLEVLPSLPPKPLVNVPNAVPVIPARPPKP